MHIKFMSLLNTYIYHRMADVNGESNFSHILMILCSRFKSSLISMVCMMIAFVNLRTVLYVLLLNN